MNQSVPTHRFSNVAIYEFPFGRGRKFFPRLPRVVDALAGGWNLSAITIFQTGMFLTPTMSIPDPAGIVYTSSGNRPLVTLRPDVLANPNVANPTIQRWFDPTVFTAPPLGRFGNSARGLVFGPGVNVTHAGIQKYIVFSDDQRAPRLRLDLAVLNVFNHPNWANPNTNVSSGAAGVITGIGGPNSGSLGDSAQQRTMRASVRLEW